MISSEDDRFRERLLGRPPQAWQVLICGVVAPALLIAFEYATGLCGRALFEVARPWPLAMFALLVPVSNGILLRYLRRPMPESAKWMVRLAAMGAGVAVWYAAIFFLPFLFSIGGVLLGLGRAWVLLLGPLLCGIPLAAFGVSVKMVRYLNRRCIDDGRAVLQGAALAVLSLLVAASPDVALRVGLRFHISALNHLATREAWLRAGCWGAYSVTELPAVAIPVSQRYVRQQYRLSTGRSFDSDVHSGLPRCLNSSGEVRQPSN